MPETRSFGQASQGRAVRYLRPAGVRPGLGRDLATLLTIKTQAGYSHEPTSLAALTRARRAMESLVAAARAA